MDGWGMRIHELDPTVRPQSRTPDVADLLATATL